jgi:hypothetical protein
MPVAHQVGKEETALTAWELAVESLVGALDHEGAAQVDPEVGRLQGHTNILAIQCDRDRRGG